MTRAIEATNTPRRKRRRHIKASTIFVIVMLFYPVAHFLLMWFAVNINSILLTFQKPDGNVLKWVDFKELFFNYETLFLSFNMQSTRNMFLASGAYFIVSCLITLPISLLFSYFVFKKILASGFFKVIFFLPSILPLVILTLVYSLALSSQGPVGFLLSSMGADTDALFIGDSAKFMVWIFCIWAGIGYDVILLTAGMSRIPRDILESCKMDGVPTFKEFIRIVIPLTWPTITTLFILGMMSVFSVFLQPDFLTSGTYQTMTIGLRIYRDSNVVAKNSPATLGLFCSIIGAPIIVAVRAGLNKMFAEVDF